MVDWQLLAPDEDARALADAARAQFGALGGPAAMRAAIDGEDAGAGTVWKAVLDGGYLDVAVPEEFGGAGRLTDLAVVLEEAGRGLLTPSPLASVLATRVQLAGGVHRADLRRAAGFAVAEGRVEDGRCHVGRAEVFGATGAATVTMVVTAPDRIWVVVTDPRAGGFEPLRDATVIDPSRPIRAYRIEGATCVEHVERPGTDLEAVLAPARLCVAADLVGTAAGALAGAVAHVSQRRQFGRPIGAFQAVKHQLADAYVAVERARSLVLGAALGERVDPVGALLANAVAAETAVLVAARYTQLMGAMGVTFEADCHLFLRRAHQTAALLGAPDELFAAAALIRRQEAR